MVKFLLFGRITKNWLHLSPAPSSLFSFLFLNIFYFLPQRIGENGSIIFEKIGAAQVDKGLQCLKIQIDTKIILIGLQDLEQAIKNNQVFAST